MIGAEYIYKTIEDIVIGLRESGSITDIAINANGDYLVTCANTLTENALINITNDNDETFSNLIVKDVTVADFVITEDISYSSAYIYSYDEKEPYFLHEKRKKANSILTKKGGQGKAKWAKYPLVLMLETFDEDLTNPQFISADIILIIVNTTDSNWNSDERHDNNIEPILDPIYDGILQGMVDSNIIQAFGIDEIAHIRTVDPFIDGDPLPDALDGIMMNFSALPFKRDCGAVALPTEFLFTLSSGDGGTATSSEGGEGSYTLVKNKPVGISATAETGYRFLNWLINSYESTSNNFAFIMNQIKYVVASFIKQWALTIEAVENGTIDPTEGSYLKDTGTIQDYIVVAAVNYEITSVTENSVPMVAVSPGLYRNTITEDFSIQALFNLIISVIQDVFSTTPVNNEFVDQVGSNNVTVKNSYAGKFDGIGSAVQINDYSFSGKSNFSIVLNVNITDLTSFQRLQYQDQTLNGSLAYAISILIGNNELYFYIFTNSGREGQIIPLTTGNHSIICTYDGTNSIIYLDGVKNSYSRTKTGAVRSCAGQNLIGSKYNGGAAYSGTMSNAQIFDKTLSDAEAAQIYNNEIVTDELKVLTFFERGQGSAVTNSVIGGAELTIINADLTSFHSGRSDDYSAIYMLGCTLFENDSDGTFMAVLYANGSPSSTSEVGFTKIDDYPAGSGILKGLPNLYNGIQYAPLTGDVDFDDIKNETETDNFQRTDPDAYSISKVEVA